MSSSHFLSKKLKAEFTYLQQFFDYCSEAVTPLSENLSVAREMLYYQIVEIVKPIYKIYFKFQVFNISLLILTEVGVTVIFSTPLSCTNNVKCPCRIG